MRILIMWGLFLCMVTTAAGQSLKQNDLYVGTFTSEGAEGIYLCSFDSGSGDLQMKETFKGIDNPNFLVLSPDGRFLYTVSRPPAEIEPSGGAVSAYRIADNGNLSFINKQASHGEDPCYVDISDDGRFVAVANYGGGSVVLYPVGAGGSLEPATSVIRHEGSGPNPQRQKKAYAHSIQFAGRSNLVLAADLGCDKLFAYRVDPATRQLVPATPPFVALPAGSGPRHFAFSPGEQLVYVANELLSTVTVFQNHSGEMREIQTISALPAGFTGVSYCADIHLSPDGQWVYVSNRGHHSIAVFKCQSDGTLSLHKNVPVEGNWPRNFTIDPSGQFMLVANQRSHNITIFRLEGGIPVFTGKELKCPAPVCLEFGK